MTHTERLRAIAAELLQLSHELHVNDTVGDTQFDRDIVTQLRRDEGESFSAYQDSLGYWTIGIGVLVDSRKGGAITRAESEMLFFNRLKDKVNSLDANIPWWTQLNDARRGVLLNMSYQMGVYTLLTFVNTLKAVKEGRYVDASVGMLQSKWAKQTPARAQRLSDQMRDGQWK